MTFQVEPGMNIYRATIEAILYCHQNNINNTDFLFNDIRLCVQHDSNAVDIVEIYSLRSEIRRLKAGYKD